VYRPASRHLNIPPPLLGIERFTEVTLLATDITFTLSTSVYVNRMLVQMNQRLYLLSQLKSQGMNVQALQTLFTGLIICLKSPTHCHPSLANFSTAEDRNRIGAISRKTQRRGVSCTDFDIDDLIDTRDRNLFSHITDPNHRLYHLLPPTAHWSYSLRKRQHGYQLPHIEYNLHKNSFINRSLYNLR